MSREQLLLVWSLALSVPYSLLVATMMWQRRRNVWTLLLGGCLLIAWPACFLLVFLQLPVVVSLFLFWWLCDFSPARAFKSKISFRTPFPAGTGKLIVATACGLVGACFWVFSGGWLPFGLN